MILLYKTGGARPGERLWKESERCVGLKNEKFETDFRLTETIVTGVIVETAAACFSNFTVSDFTVIFETNCAQTHAICVSTDSIEES